MTHLCVKRNLGGFILVLRNCLLREGFINVIHLFTFFECLVLFFFNIQRFLTTYLNFDYSEPFIRTLFRHIFVSFGVFSAQLICLYFSFCHLDSTKMVADSKDQENTPASRKTPATKPAGKVEKGAPVS